MPLVMIGCATAPARSRTGSQSQVTITHLPEVDGWRVHYQLPAPTSVAVFFRQGAVRLGRWKVVAPADAKLVTLAGKEVLVAAHPTDTFDLELPTHLSHPQRDYEAFTPFFDRSVVVFTGQFDLTPVVCLPEACSAEQLTTAMRVGRPAAFRFEPRPSERLILSGELRDHAVDWPGSEDGTMVYFGSTPPLRQGRLILVVDRGFPAWLRTRIEDLLPAAFRLYEQRTSVRLSFPPTVFLSFGEEPGRRRINVTGGTRQGIVQLDIRLGADRQAKEDPETVEAVMGVVAHEAAHLWNAEMFIPAEEEHSWMHEGGAQAFAFRALVELGAMTPARYAEKLSAAASDCAAALVPGMTLEQTIAQGNEQAVYACGWVIAEATGRAALRKDQSHDLFRFWSDLFKASAATHAYDPSAYFRVLAQNASAEDADTVRALVSSPAKQPTAAWVAAKMNALGLAVAVDDDAATGDYVRAAAIGSLRRVLTSGCERVTGISAGRDTLEVAAAACAGVSGPLAITGVEGHPVFAGLATLAAAERHCATDKEVALTVAGSPTPLRLRCEAPFPPTPRFLRVAPPPDLQPPPGLEQQRKSLDQTGR